jgi:predicted DsbA family dithiol-disulfide isomerase
MKTTPMPIEIFVDFVCPWCYLASGVVAKLQEHTPLDVKWLPFPLHPSTPPEGMLLKDMLRGMDLEAAHKRIYALMDEIGLEHGPREHTWNSRLAQELALWAETQPGGAALPPLLYRAYFVHDRNLADIDVLLAEVAAAGLDVDEARSVLHERSFSDAVDAAWERARSYRIGGVPTFIAGGYQMTGFQPLPELQRFIDFVRDKQA